MFYNIPDMQQDETVKGRLIEYLRRKNISQYKFERACGLANGFVSSIGKSIREESLDKISVIYPDLSKSWLMLGEGSMLIESETTKEKNDVKKEVTGNEIKIQMLQERIVELTARLEETLQEIGALRYEKKLREENKNVI